MGDVVPFDKKPKKNKTKGKSMCSQGFHKWVVEKKNQFDVKQGKLVTVYKCTRCHKLKITAH